MPLLLRDWYKVSSIILKMVTIRRLVQGEGVAARPEHSTCPACHMNTCACQGNTYTFS